ncbi:hypothetical protein DJ544_06850 [Enterobacter roggenkampii]|nr:hypothetical protein DJ544_06850 [Enterobacter roggenkampii]
MHYLCFLINFFILYSLFFILYSLFFILYSLFFILYSLSFVFLQNSQKDILFIFCDISTTS